MTYRETLQTVDTLKALKIGVLMEDNKVLMFTFLAGLCKGRRSKTIEDSLSSRPFS